MAKLEWSAKIGTRTFEGTVDDPKGEVRILVDAPAGTLGKVVAQIDMPMTDSERIFMNGYQTWTHSPEHTKRDRVRGVNRIPKWILRKYHIDHFGDYHFVDYPYLRGHFHGFSWCYIRSGETFRLIGSLDERPGYTIFRYDADRCIMSIERDCEGVAHEGGSFEAFGLYFAEGTEDEVFDGWFAAMEPKCVCGEPVKGYSSWYNRYEDISEKTILEDLDGCKQLFCEGDLFQVDDGWEPAVGDWLEADPVKFPSGMKAMADAAHDAGFKAGLWLAPFVCEKDSALYRDHPDWLLKVGGKPWACGPNWSGFYSLDIDNPEVVDYLRRVFDRVVNEWGFDLLKLDFLYGAAPFGNERESRAGRMIHAMEMLREWCADAKILGCGVPVMPAFGQVDYCRIGCDVSLNGKGDLYMRALHSEVPSTRNAMDNAVYRRELDGRAYGSDPDVFFLREDNIKMSEGERKQLAHVCALFGSVFLTSDNPATYTDEARAFYNELLELRDAEIVKVRPRGKHRWTVTYVLGGKKHKIRIKTP